MTTQLAALRMILADGKTHGIDSLENMVAKRNGRKPSRGALHVYLNALRKEGFKFEVEGRGPGKITKYTATKVPKAAKKTA